MDIDEWGPRPSIFTIREVLRTRRRGAMSSGSQRCAAADPEQGNQSGQNRDDFTPTVRRWCWKSSIILDDS